MAIRTAATRSRIQGEAQRRRAQGIDTVLVSQYGACSPTCLPWQGRVYIDDVWGEFDGETCGAVGRSADGNFYPLLSVAVGQGLFHPNCRHTATTYRRGVTRIPPPMDAAKVSRASALERQQRAGEREIRRLKRLEASCLDPDTRRKYKAQLRAAQQEQRELVAEHGDILRRDYWREKGRSTGLDSLSAGGWTTGQASDKIQAESQRRDIPPDIKAIKRAMAEQTRQLAPERQKILREYSGFAATRMNTAIRADMPEHLREQIASLDDALKDGVMPQDVTLYRDTELSFLKLDLPENPTPEQLASRKGRVVVNEIFTSTSFRHLELPGRDTVLILHVPKGYRGCRYIEPVAYPKFKWQDEVLFARGLSYRIIKAEKRNGKYILEARVMMRNE